MTNNPISIPEKVSEPLPVVSRRDYAALALFLLFSFAAANCVYTGGTRIGFAVSAFGLLFSALLYLRSNLRPSFLGILHLAAAVLILVSFALYEHTSFSPLKLLFFYYTLSVAIVFCGKLPIPTEDFRILFAPFYLFFGISCRTIPTAASALGGKRSGAVWKKIGKMLLAITISMPLLAFLFALLYFADKAFEHTVNSMELNLDTLLVTVIFGTLLFICLFPLAFALRKDRVRLKQPEAKPYIAVLDATFTNTVLAAVALLYFAFLATQISYLTGGFSGNLAGYTFSDYARQGFFEMCVISVINLCLLCGTALFIRRSEDGKLPAVTRVLSVFISLFSVFLIVSAIAKMLLYIRELGLTFLRLGTSIFMLLLFFVFVALIVKTFVPRFKAMRMVLAAAGIIMGLTAFTEPYNMIVGYNMYAYDAGWHERIDIQYLADTCGDFAVPALIQLTEDGDTEIAAKAKEKLDGMQNRYSFQNSTDPRAWTLTRHTARKALAEYYAE